MRTELLCISARVLLRVASGLKVKLACCKSALNPTPPPPPHPARWVFQLTKAVVPVLILFSVILWFISTRRFVLCLTLCYYVFVFFSPFSIAITSLGEEKPVLVLFVRLLDLRLF